MATVKAVLNSIYSINKYSNIYSAHLINVFGEWNFIKEQNSKIRVYDMFLSKNFSFKSSITGFLKSRFIYLLTGLFTIFSLFNLIKKQKPDYIIIHLITYIPLILSNLFKSDTKFILRISGYPKLTFFRKLLWKISSKSLFKIFCPTQGTLNNLLKENIFPKEKLFLLEDPIIDISKIKKLQKKPIPDFLKKSKFILAIGRLSKQKNYKLLLSFFKKINVDNKEIKLVIAGAGEERKKIEEFIMKNDLTDHVHLLGYVNNVHNLLYKSYLFILTSLWEDPGFVIVEAAMNNSNIISSDCPSGPRELLSEGNAGLLFSSNNLQSLIESYKKFNLLNDKQLNKMKINAKRNILKYTIFRHFKKLNGYLNVK